MRSPRDLSPPSSPRKKLKMDPSEGGLGPDETIGATEDLSNVSANGKPSSSDSKPTTGESFAQLHGETDVGITEFVSPDLPGFRGILKKRYTDFLVNEILPSGQVIHLDNLKAPPRVKTVAAETEAEFQHSTAPVSLPNPEQARQDSVLAPERSTLISKTANDTEKANLEISSPQIANVIDERHNPTTIDDVSEATTANGFDDVKAAEAKASWASNLNDGASKWQAYASEASLFTLTRDDENALKVFFSEDTIARALALFNRVTSSPHRKVRDYGLVESEPIPDRQLRTKAHQEIRRIFADRLDSNTGDDGKLTISAKVASSGSQDWNHRGGNWGRGGHGSHGRGGRDRRHNQPQNRPYKSQKELFAELGGEHLHFSLYKENKDTMEVVSYLARQLNTKPRSFQFAGTKDRRAATVQRISVYRIQADRMVSLGRTLRNAKIGNYEYHPYGLELGELTGNEFVITLRDCEFDGVRDASTGQRVTLAKEIVNTAMKHLTERGFLNYFGLQRFGTFATRTDTVGIKMLQGDFNGAVDAILEFSPSALAAVTDPTLTDVVSRDDKARALAIDSFQKTGKSQSALGSLPKKFSAETNIIRHLGSANRANDYQGALALVPRNLRLIYVHAYQSLIWNLAASYRWRQYGQQLIEGDLVLVNEHRADDVNAAQGWEEVDADGEAIVRPAAEDRAANDEDRFERARALSKEEVESGTYSIFDVVLPTPGYDVLYPSNMISFYETTMRSEQYGKLDPHDMRRSWKDISLSGSYRKLLARPGKDSSSNVLPYYDDHEQLVQTDLDRLNVHAETSKKARAADSGIIEEAENDKGLGEVKKGKEGMAEGVRNSDAEAQVGAQQQKLAAIIHLQLGVSQYATMALRELMKLGGAQTYKADFGGGR